MTDLNPAYLEWRLSGGADNADPGTSLGGPRSAFSIRAHSVTAAPPLTGVRLLDALGTVVGVGTLDYQCLIPALLWTPPHGEPGPTVALISDGRALVPGATGYLALDITLALLPSDDQRLTVTIQPLANQLWDDIPAAVSQAGAVQYRCAYLCNTHPTQAFDYLRLWIPQQPAGADRLALALDQAGVGDGLTTGVAGLIEEATAVPASALAFSVPGELAAALALGPLGPGQALAVWQRRTIPPLTLTSRPWDASELRLSITY